jgi:putative lipid A biosynthesis acyltransferase
MEYKLSEKIIGVIVITIKKILSFFPLKVRYSFFENLGLLGYYLIKKRRVLTIDNIKRAFPEKTDKEVIRIAKESYKTMGKMVMTSIFLEDITTNGHTVIENEELILKACEDNKKAVIIVSLHLGGFEAGSIMRSIRKFYAVFRRQKNRKLNDLMTEWREKGGLHSIPLRDSEALNSALKNKTLIALASDHHADDVEIEFFGRKTTAVSGPVLLGLKHKIPLVLSYAIFEGNTVKVINKKILEIEKKENLKATVKYNMQKIFYEFEEIIKEYPEQYMWQHKRWRDE